MTGNDNHDMFSSKNALLRKGHRRPNKMSTFAVIDKPKIKKYQLYTNGPDEKISAKYMSQTWKLDIFAVSYKQAYYFVHTQKVSSTIDKLGIYFIDNNDGPGAFWPWSLSMKTITPPWWTK